MFSFFFSPPQHFKKFIQSVGQKIFHFLLDKFTFIWYYKYNKGVDIMVEKNKKKQEAKKQRNMWTINPRTRRKGNDKAYNRQRDKKVKDW